jgi:hypothetical protein
MLWRAFEWLSRRKSHGRSSGYQLRSSVSMLWRAFEWLSLVRVTTQSKTKTMNIGFNALASF